MKKISYFLITIFITTLLGSCSENDVPNKDLSVIQGTNEQQTQFDKFLKKEFITPFNIEFLYKLPDVESDLNYALVPANYQNSVRMANLVKYLCLEPYKNVAPEGFMKEHFPKMILLVGSSAYRNNGTRVLGTAEGGLKITLYDINNLDVTNIDALNEFYFRTIYHEFSHILHQKKPYTTDFEKITPTLYVGDSWNEAWTASKPSNEAGFISDYSSKEPNEDFVELIAHYITNTQDQWDAKISAAGDNGGSIIQQKMLIVKDYLKNVWELDIDELRDEIQQRADNLDSQDFDNIN